MRESETAMSLQPKPALPSRLLSTQEAADYLNVPVRWLQDAVQQRRVRCTRIGKHVRFTAAHLIELIEAGEQPVTQSLHAVITPSRNGGRRSAL